MAEIAPPRVRPDVLSRLPRTFGPPLQDQLRRWDLLFPAEQRVLRAQVEWLMALPEGSSRELFARLADTESRMELPGWERHADGMTVEQAGILARSPLYPEWRREVESVFARIEDGVARSQPPRDVRRLIVCILPAGIPLEAKRLWPELTGQGTWTELDAPFGTVSNAFVRCLAGRRLQTGVEPIESTWAYECDTTLAPIGESTPALVLSWAALEALRREFLSRLNAIRRTLFSVDQTTADLRRMDIRRLTDGRIGASPLIREFVRNLLLSGNGALVFNNSFVQWGASETLRRVEPQVLVAAFGVRPKLKPFSSAVLFEDQRRSNPVGDADDPAGSLVDAMKLSTYVYLAAQRVRSYSKNTVTLMAAPASNRLLVLGMQPPPQLTSEALTNLSLDWLRAL